MRSIVLVTLMSLGGVPTLTAAVLPYDSESIKDIMHANVAAADAVSQAIAAGDWVALANGFLQFAQNAQKALQSAPPKGDLQEWARIWEDLQFAAYRGVGAAGEKDADKAKAALAQIIRDRNTGHPKFKG